MRILLVTQYFYPENFRINDMVLGLKERGHEVEVLTGKPNYPNGSFFEGYSFFAKRLEYWNGIKIHRSPLFPRGSGGGLRLFLNYFSHAFFSSWRVLCLRGNFDQIFVYEPSPVTIGIPAIVAKYRFRAPIHFWIQDLWPQSLQAAGGVNNRVVLSIVEGLTRWIYKHCDSLLIQSKAFEEVVMNQVYKKNKVFYFPNSVEGFFQPIEKKPEYKKFFTGSFNLLFAGNIGESQDFETLIEAARIVKESDSSIHWIILGNGRKKNEYEKRVTERSLQDVFHFKGSFPVTEMPYFFSHADALLVSLKDEQIFSLTIPSKVQSYLACGKPIVASLNGEGRRVIEESKSGTAANAESPNELAEKILEIKELSGKELEKLGNNGREYFKKNFDRELLLDRLDLHFKNNYKRKIK